MSVTMSKRLTSTRTGNHNVELRRIGQSSCWLRRAKSRCTLTMVNILAIPSIKERRVFMSGSTLTSTRHLFLGMQMSQSHLGTMATRARASNGQAAMHARDV